MVNPDTDLTQTWRELSAQLMAMPSEELCEVRSPSGPCSRPAAWLANFHGCSAGLMCTEHLEAWLHQVAALMHPGHGAPCTLCGQTFFTVDAACLATPL